MHPPELRIMFQRELLDVESAVEKGLDVVETLLSALLVTRLHKDHLTRIQLGYHFRESIQSGCKRRPHGLASIINSAIHGEKNTIEEKVFQKGGTTALGAVAQLQSFDSPSKWQRQDFAIPPSSSSSHLATARSSASDRRGSISHGRVAAMDSSSMPGPPQGQNSSNLHGSLSDGWTMGLPTSDPLAISVFSNQIRIPPLQGGEGLQFEELFGDHWAAWNMQLWPLMGEGGIEGANSGADVANDAIS